MTFIDENIPTMLKEHRNWVVWGVQDSPLKAPYNPASLISGKPQFAKAGIRETWSDYQTATQCVNQGLAHGVGYQFDGNGIFGVDLDSVLDKSGKLTNEAIDIIYKLNSYTEYSPSGTGIHIIVKAPSAEITRHRKKDYFLEIYGKDRYFTVTGNICGCNKDIATRTIELQEIHDKFLLPTTSNKAIISPKPTTSDNSMYDRLLNIGLNRDNVFNALWHGERRHGNESADDIALMNKLAYWCNTDSTSMIQAFLSSPYYSQKNDAHKKKCRRSDYLANTAKNSSDSVRSTAAIDYERWQQNKNRERDYIK